MNTARQAETNDGSRMRLSSGRQTGLPRLDGVGQRGDGTLLSSIQPDRWAHGGLDRYAEFFRIDLHHPLAAAAINHKQPDSAICMQAAPRHAQTTSLSPEHSTHLPGAVHHQDRK